MLHRFHCVPRVFKATLQNYSVIIYWYAFMNKIRFKPTFQNCSVIIYWYAFMFKPTLQNYSVIVYWYVFMNKNRFKPTVQNYSVIAYRYAFMNKTRLKLTLQKDPWRLVLMPKAKGGNMCMYPCGVKRKKRMKKKMTYSMQQRGQDVPLVASSNAVSK